MYPKNRGNKSSSWKSHYCGRYGHIRPYFYRLYGYPQPYSKLRLNKKTSKNIQARKVWKPKITTTCLITYTTLRVSSREYQYYDSGCSRHMTRENNYLEELKTYFMLLLVMVLEEKSRIYKN